MQRLGHLDTAHHADLERLDRHVFQYRPGLFHQQCGIQQGITDDPVGILAGDGGDHRRHMASHADGGLDVGGDTRATGGVMAGKDHNHGDVFFPVH